MAPGHDVAQYLLDRKTSQPKQDVSTAIAELLPKRLAVALCDRNNVAGRLADLPDKALRRLAAAIKAPRLAGLTVLQLGDTNVGDAGALALAEALEHQAMPEGQQLWLAACPITDEGRRQLMAAIARRPRRGGSAELRVCW